MVTRDYFYIMLPDIIKNLSPAQASTTYTVRLLLHNNKMYHLNLSFMNI